MSALHPIQCQEPAPDTEGAVYDAIADAMTTAATYSETATRFAEIKDAGARLRGSLCISCLVHGGRADPRVALLPTGRARSMMVHLPRHARRRLQRLVGHAEAAIQADAKFFRRFPERQHRVRLAARAEVEQFGLIAGAAPYLQLGPDQLAFVIVKQIAPGVRLKAVVAGPAVDAGEDHPEHFAAALWNKWLRLHPYVAERQARIEAAALGLGGRPDEEGRPGS